MRKLTVQWNKTAIRDSYEQTPEISRTFTIYFHNYEPTPLSCFNLCIYLFNAFNL